MSHEAPTCSHCGATSEADEVPLTWSTGVESERPVVVCDQCTRANVRAIEGKLDREWW